MTVNVDPKTGSIVKSGQDQQRFLEDGTPRADVQLTQTDDTVKEAVDEAKTAGKSLTILLTVVPIVGHRWAALLCLIGGLRAGHCASATRRGRRRRRRPRRRRSA